MLVIFVVRVVEGNNATAGSNVGMVFRERCLVGIDWGGERKK